MRLLRGLKKALLWSDEITTLSAHSVFLNYMIVVTYFSTSIFKKSSIIIYRPKATWKTLSPLSWNACDEKLNVAYDFLSKRLWFFSFYYRICVHLKKREFLLPCHELLVSTPSASSPFFPAVVNISVILRSGQNEDCYTQSNITTECLGPGAVKCSEKWVT